MANPRISARRGQVVNLDVQFYRDGILVDPYAIRKVEIYQTAVETSNLLVTIPFVDPWNVNYPLPAVRTGVGEYYLPFLVPTNFEVPNVFMDLWYFYADIPTNITNLTEETNLTSDPLDNLIYEQQLLKCCHRFWCYPDGWACADNLTVINFSFEPLSIHFNKPEVRPLEVGIMALPLYDYDYNLVAPIMPFLQCTISIQTRNCELLVDEDPMTIGLRQGSYRSNPFTLRYTMDSSKYLIGTYKYRCTVMLPDGSTRTSRWFMFDVG